jgi:protocatechuate 3,4-dioxygenase beta subunit
MASIDDDAPVGRILSRREILALLGGSGLAAFAAACAGTATATPAPATASGALASASAAVSAPLASAAVSCIVTPALTEGPYFVDEKLERSDIRSDPASGQAKPGAQLALTVSVFRASGTGCTPLSGAVVDVWHCDALGAYSDAADATFNTKGSKFLRGYQTTDASGRAQFTTIYPGWYQGRAVHIHFKIRTTTAGRTSDFTSQFFFDEGLNDKVLAQAPYSQKPASGRTRNERDGIYQQSAGKTTLVVTQAGSLYTAAFNIGLTI